MNFYSLFHMLFQENSGGKFKMLFHILMLNNSKSFLLSNSRIDSYLIESYNTLKHSKGEIVAQLNILPDWRKHEHILNGGWGSNFFSQNCHNKGDKCKNLMDGLPDEIFIPLVDAVIGSLHHFVKKMNYVVYYFRWKFLISKLMFLFMKIISAAG